MQYDTTILQFKPKTTYKEHRAKMEQLKYFYDRGWMSQVEVLVMFLDHLEQTTGIRPYYKPYPYKESITKEKAA